MQQSRLAATAIDLIIVATMSPDYLTPATAPQVQAAIGAEKAIAFDINVACAGSVYGMHLRPQDFRQGQVCLFMGEKNMHRLVD
ncbi:3-oxoacyl-ACP synthase, partial [Lactiplantibacillus plantarum]